MPVKRYDGTNWVTVAGDGAAGAPGTSSSISTWVKTASGGETSVSGSGDAGYGTLAYTVGQELVFLNGVMQVRGTDYTATNGTSITGLTALSAGDIVTVWTVNAFSVANTYTQSEADSRFAPISVTGGMTLISTTTLSGAATTINSIPTTYKSLVAFIYGITNASANYNMTIQPNSTANLAYAIVPQNINNIAQQDKTTNGDIQCHATSTQTGANSTILQIDNYASSSVYKPFIYRGFVVNSAGDLGFAQIGGIKTNSQITSLKFNASAGTFNAGTVELYGVK